MTTATTTSASVLPARFAPKPLRSRSEGTACLSARDPTGSARSRLRDAIAEFRPLICLIVPRSDEANITPFRADHGWIHGVITLNSAGILASIDD